jgi:pyrroloquinoline quinone biosynthesis protein B
VDIRLIVLGAGQDGGSPQFGRTLGRGAPRSASSVAVIADGGVALLDASPDLRMQFATLVGLIGDRPARSPFDVVCITHGHMGHYAGLVHLGKEAAATRETPLYAPHSVLSFLLANEPWRSLFVDRHVLSVPSDEAPFSLGEVAIRAIDVPHRSEHTTTVAFSIEVNGDPWALYVPDVDSWDAWPRAEETLSAHSLCLVDATFSSRDEVAGRDLSDIPHPLVTDTIERFAHLTGDRRIVLTHINHSNEVADPTSAVARRAISAGFMIAHDGLVLDRGRV